MIQNIIAMLGISDFIGQSEFIDIAKGKYKLNRTFKDTMKQIKREVKTAINKK